MFDKLKAEPAAPGVKHLQDVCTTLQRLRAVGLPPDALADIPAKVLQTLTRRGLNEDASQMRAHPTPIRYTLLACVLHVRTMEVTDDAVRMLLEIIRRMDTQTEKHLQKELLRDMKRVTGKVQLLYRIAEAVMEAPDGTIRNVLFPCVKEATFCDLVAEAKASHPQYRSWYQALMRQKFMRHYRRMLPLVRPESSGTGAGLAMPAGRLDVPTSSGLPPVQAMNSEPGRVPMPGMPVVASACRCSRNRASIQGHCMIGKCPVSSGEAEGL